MKLKEIRKSKSLTQKEVGDIIGLDQRTISAIEKGKSVLNHRQIIKFCETLKVSADDLLGISYEVV